MTPQQDVFQVTARRKQPALAASPASNTAPPLLFPTVEPRRTPAWVIWLWLGGVLLVLPHAVSLALHLFVIASAAAALEPAVSYCTRRRMPRAIASALFVTLLALVVAGFVFALTPSIRKEIAGLTALLNSSAAEKIASKLSILLLRALPWLRTRSILRQLQDAFTPRITEFLQAGAGFEVALLANLLSYGLIAAGTFYLLHWGDRARTSLMRTLPNRYLEMGALLLERMTPRLAQHLRVQALLCLCASLLMAAALALMGLPGAFLMSVFGGLALLTPYWGIIAAAIPMAIASANATNSLHVVLGIVLALALLQLLINTLVALARLRATVRLRAGEALLALLLGGSIAGVWGLLLAGPLAGLAKIALQVAQEVRKDFR